MGGAPRRATSATPYLRRGDLIEVKSREEILATLDAHGCLDGMPFMPEMLDFCGRRVRVANVAHKACDSKCKTGGRSVPDCVHLENSRCDGSAHGGCQARCTIFWKTAWLRKVDASATNEAFAKGRVTEAGLADATSVGNGPKGTVYRCQATQIVAATQPLAWWDARQYARDVTSGNVSVGRAARVLFLSWVEAPRRLPRPYRLSRWFYDRIHQLVAGKPSPFAPHDFNYPTRSPAGRTDLRVGEWVRVKPHVEILATLNKDSRNRGLWFDPELVQFCGKEFRVALRVEKIIDELTGEMLYMKGPCIMLEGVASRGDYIACRGEYTQNRRLCPKAMPIYWREIWLERVEAPAESRHVQGA
jgi:hypothetical protein